MYCKWKRVNKEEKRKIYPTYRLGWLGAKSSLEL